MGFDCAVIGGGLGGSVTAMALARSGLSVLVLEARSHPRFAIGESLVPTTSYGLRTLARVYGIPEIDDVSHFLGLEEIGCAGYPKQGFWFGVHRDGTPLQWAEQSLFLSPGLPLGPDVHMLRSDVDAYLAGRLASHGVEYRDLSPVTRIDFADDGVLLHIEGNETFRARFLVDASGPGSPLARQLGLRLEDPGMHTHSRALFSHFADVPTLEETLDRTAPIMVTNRDTCTIHHCFDGGWSWFIRFATGVVSVGIMLDGNRPWPGEDGRADDEPPEREFWRVVERFPTIAAGLRGARMIRPMIRTPRVQYRNRTCFGDRFAILPHASAFIDPLFSTGLNLTQAFIRRLVPTLVQALDEDRLDAERFADIGQVFEDELAAVDLLVASTYASFRDFDVFKQTWRAFSYASVLQYLCQASEAAVPQAPYVGLYGARVPLFRRLLARIHDEVTRRDVEARVVAERLSAMWQDVAEPFPKDTTHWELDADEPCVPDQSKGVAVNPWFTSLRDDSQLLTEQTRLERLDELLQAADLRARELAQKADDSRASGGTFHRVLEFIENSRQYASRRAATPPDPIG